MRLPWVKINAKKRPITEAGAHYIIAFVGQKPQSVMMTVYSLLQIEKKRLRSAPMIQVRAFIGEILAFSKNVMVCSNG